MKIIFSNYDDINNPYYGGGGAIAIHEIAKRLVSIYGHDVTVVTSKYRGSKDRTIGKVKYIRIGTTIPSPRLAQLIYMVVTPLYVRSLNFDVWIEGFTPPFSTGYLPIFTQKPVVGLTNFLSSEAKSRQYHLPFTFIETAGIKRYLYFIALSPSLKTKIKKINPRAVVKVIPYGTNIKSVVTINTHPQNYLLYLGRYDVAQKGIDLLLKAFNLSKDNHTNNLIIAGGGINNEVQHIKDLIAKLGLQKRVILMGKIWGKDKEKLMKNAQFIVIPSRSETLCLVAVEAIVLGTPVVCFAIDGLDWIPGSVSMKVAPFDLTKLSKAIVKLSTSSAVRNKLARQTKHISSKFKWGDVVHQYQQLLMQIKDHD